jgi:Ca2+/Na+ antiporter
MSQVSHQIPDTMSSIALAKRGFYDGAMAGAIGSQVINLSIGIGFPALLRCLLNPEKYTLSADDSGSLWLLIILVCIVVAGYVCSIAPIWIMVSRCHIPDHGSFTRRGAMCLFGLWLTMICTFIFLNET